MNASTVPTRAWRWSNFDLLYSLVERQLLLRRKRSMIGAVWPMLGPVMLTALYTFVFNSVFTVPIQKYPIYLFAGLLPWTLLLLSLTGGLTSISSESALIRRAPFPYQLLPVSLVVVNAIPFLVLLVGFVVVDAVTWKINVWLLPALALPFASLVLLCCALTMVLAAIDVFNHTLRYLLGNVMTGWFFIVPIVYRPDQAGSIANVLRSIDPMNMIIGQFRDILYYGHLSRPGHTVLMVIVCTMSFVVASTVFTRLAPQFPKEL
jgi:ABC-type polysaccharide/polyol phosphate export permease